MLLHYTYRPKAIVKCLFVLNGGNKQDFFHSILNKPIDNNSNQHEVTSGTQEYKIKSIFQWQCLTSIRSARSRRHMCMMFLKRIPEDGAENKHRAENTSANKHLKLVSLCERWWASCFKHQYADQSVLQYLIPQM